MSDFHTNELDLELLTDVCVTTSNRTLGEPDTRTCIPGRALWGAAANAAYRDRLEETEVFRILHQGCVRILDAVPTGSGGRAYPVPRSWQQRKDRATSTVHNFALGQVRSEMANVQCKPLGDGWLTPDRCLVEVRTDFSLRTSVDPSGRARPGLLFGLPVIRAGLRLWTSVCGPRGDVEKVVELLERADLRLGRSRNAELGLVRARRRKEPIRALSHGRGRVNQVFFLCVSRCILRDPHTGAATLLPFAQAFGLPEPDRWEFDEASSAIRTARIVPFNSKRRRPESERFAIELGSIICFRGGPALDLETVARNLAFGVGEFRGEGYGEVLVNPEWLTLEKLELSQEPGTSPSPVKEPDDELYRWARDRAGKKQLMVKLYEQAVESAREFARYRIPSAQWGALRRMAREARFAGRHEQLRDQVKSFVESGRRKIAPGWNRGAPILLEQLEKQGTQMPIFLELLAAACVRPADSETREEVSHND